jgi:hypothetical protein
MSAIRVDLSDRNNNVKILGMKGLMKVDKTNLEFEESRGYGLDRGTSLEEL